MGSKRDVQLPDIGDFENVEVAEVLVSPGQEIEAEQSLIVLESDKASMEIPAPFAGTVVEVVVGVGDQVSQGDRIAVVEVKEDAADAEPAGGEKKEEADATAGREEPPAAEEPEREEQKREPKRDEKKAEAASAEAETAPRAEREEPEEGDPRAERGQPEEGAPRAAAASREGEAGEADERDEAGEAEPAEGAAAPAESPPPATRPHASPSVRRLARELGAELTLVPGTGRKGRITHEDVRGYVKAMLRKGTAAGVPIAGVSVAPPPQQADYAKFGPTEVEPLHRIRKLSAANLHRSWVTIPHVTQHDEADITDLDAFRREIKPEAEARGTKLTFLPFVIKACTAALAEFPSFNASLDHTGENLIVKRYYHVGVAVDTPGGLVVPVVKDADRKGLFELADELGLLSEKARSRKLHPADLQGASFSISSLGGLGGTFFTPIVNHPEVAILGVGRMDWRPVYDGEAFVPRLVLPLSLSYDHRVIDGADAARFTTRLGRLLSDLRRLIL